MHLKGDKGGEVKSATEARQHRLYDRRAVLIDVALYQGACVQEDHGLSRSNRRMNASHAGRWRTGCQLTVVGQGSFATLTPAA